MMSNNLTNDSPLRHKILNAKAHNAEQSISAVNDQVRATPHLDLSIGMLHGYHANYGAYVSNTGYTPRNVIPFLIEAPRGFKYMINPELAVATLKSLMENQSKIITGLRTGYNVEFTDRQISGAGQQMSDPANVVEEISTPAHTWDERYNKGIQKYWMSHVRNLIADPSTKQPGIMNLVERGNEPTDQLADFYSFTMLYVEPDPLRRYVVDAWLINGMVPKGTGTHESGYDIAADWSVPEIEIEFTGMPVQSMGIRQMAQELLDGLDYRNAGPLHQPAHASYTSQAIIDQKHTGNREYQSAYAASGSPVTENGGFPDSTQIVPPGEAPAIVDSVARHTASPS